MIFSVKTADLLHRNCHHQTTGLSDGDLRHYVAAVEGWVLQDGRLTRSFNFNNYYQTLAFVNAIAYVIHAEDHHPDLAVTYQCCTVRYHTHSVNGGKGGITENDFICAAKIDAIFRQSFVP